MCLDGQVEGELPVCRDAKDMGKRRGNCWHQGVTEGLGEVVQVKECGECQHLVEKEKGIVCVKAYERVK